MCLYTFKIVTNFCRRFAAFELLEGTDSEVCSRLARIAQAELDREFHGRGNDGTDTSPEVNNNTTKILGFEHQETNASQSPSAFNSARAGGFPSTYPVRQPFVPPRAQPAAG